MNIFVTSNDPKLCAMFLDDKRVNKMILESAQLLATAINENGGSATYKTTHKNHPSAIWTRSTRSNYMWLVEHFKALINEKLARTNKGHKSSNYLQEFIDNAHLIPDGPLTDFANCAANNSLGMDFKNVKCTFKAYREYLFNRWLNDKLQPKWYGINANSFLTKKQNKMLDECFKLV